MSAKNNGTGGVSAPRCQVQSHNEEANSMVLPTKKTGGNVDTGAALTVNGWHVETREDRTFVYDLDIAERAELIDPHDIRRTIAKAIEDGALQVPAAAHDLDSPAFLIEQELVPMPGGRGMRKSTAYRLNRAAALFIVTRLRTSKAVELTLAIIKVFDQVTSGRAPVVANAGPSADVLAFIQESRAERLEMRAEILTLHRKIDALASCPAPQMVGRATGDHIRARLRTYASLMAPSKREVARWRMSGTHQLQGAARFSGKGSTWDRLPAADYPIVDRTLDMMIGMAEAVAKRKQMTLLAG